MNNESTIAERLFEGTAAECELEGLLYDAGVPYEKLGWDHYDLSLEIHGVASDYRLPAAVVTALLASGFLRVYVNHVDKWETHYTEKNLDGFRVSYPHKRENEDGGIWLEKPCPTWPKEWFESGYAVVKEPSQSPPVVTPHEGNGTDTPNGPEGKLWRERG